MSSENQPDMLARCVARVTAWVARHPWLVLAIALIVTVAACRIAYTDLGYHTQRNDLLSADRPCQQRWQKYLDAFGDDDDLVVVAEGTNPERMKAALDAVADEVKRRPDLFDRVFYKVDLRPLHDRAILHLSTEQLSNVAARLDRMEPLLGPVGPVAWRMLSVQSLLASGSVALEAQAAGRELTASDRDLLAQLPAVAASAADALRDPDTYRNPWALGGAAPGLPSGARSDNPMLTPQYFLTPDGTLALLTCRPKKAADSFTPAKESNAAMRAILAGVSARFPGVSLGLTGIPVLETDEMELSDTDSTRASWLALLGIAVLYFVVYRGPRYPLLTITSLVVGTLWALGWATITVGHLNILSATFAVMLIGLGDYGVLWVARYDEERQRHATVEEALRATALHAGPSILTAAATTGLAFFAVMLADFKAVAELGWIAGSGVILCAASCLVVLPALVVLAERRANRKVPGNADSVGETASGCETSVIPFPTAWIPGLANRPRLVLGIGAILLVGCAACTFRLSYDHNLLNLQPRGLDSVAWEHKLIDRAAGATWDAMSIAATREGALALKAKYEAIPEVGRVVEVASLIPADQDQKLPFVRRIHAKLASLPAQDKLPTPVGSNPDAVRELAAKVAALAGPGTALSLAAESLRAATDSSPYAAERLRRFDRRLAADLGADLHQLKAVAHPALVTAADVPPELRERYIGASGEFLVRAFARDSLWEHEALMKFTTTAATADPEATGKAFRTLEGLRQMKVGFEWAAVYALAAIVFVLLLDMRRFDALLMGLFPLVVGVMMTLGVMGLCGLSLNPANMIALPLIVGVGVDNGVHVLHDYRSRPPGVAYRLGSATGRGVLVAALTTVLGFGTLITARHQGMASLGLALTLGVTFCMVASLAFLPAVLRLRDIRRLKRERSSGATQPAPAVIRMATAKVA